MNTLLPAFLAEGGRVPFVWGERDCCLWACDWVRSARGIDPAAPLRGSYSTRAGAYRHILAAGGLRTLAITLAAQAGLSETSDPLPGDIGLVRTGQQEVLAVKTRVGWAAKAPQGIVTGPFDMVVAWSV